MIPPNLSVENQDAGQNAPPTILAVRGDTTEFAEPGPIPVLKQTGSSLSLDLLDTDVLDELTVRFFVDYLVTEPTAPRATCVAPSIGKVERTLTCDLSALCLTADVNVRRNMSILVFDREPLDAQGNPPFQGMAEDSSGLSTSRFYFLECMNP